MPTPPESSTPRSLSTRTEPVQKRSTDRISLLLDAAAELIDSHGIEGLTTSDVAARSGSSVGVVYRYFPNIQSLLRALAARNMQQFTEQIAEAAPADDWREGVQRTVDLYVQHLRTSPGFRALGFGDIIDRRLIEPDFDNNGVLARSFAGLLVEKYGFEYSDDLVHGLEVLVALVDALLKRAFLNDAEGDDRFIADAKLLVQNYTLRYEPFKDK